MLESQQIRAGFLGVPGVRVIRALTSLRGPLRTLCVVLPALGCAHVARGEGWSLPTLYFGSSPATQIDRWIAQVDERRKKYPDVTAWLNDPEAVVVAPELWEGGVQARARNGYDVEEAIRAQRYPGFAESSWDRFLAGLHASRSTSIARHSPIATFRNSSTASARETAKRSTT